MQKTKFFLGLLIPIIFVLVGISWFTIYLFNFFFEFSKETLSILYAIFTITPAVLLTSMLTINKYYSKANSIIYTIFIFWIPKIFYLFGISIVLAFLYLAGLSTCSLFYAALTMIIVSFLLFIYGIWNALNPKVITYEINAPKLKEKWGDKKVVLFSDSHLGAVRHERFMKQIVKMINELSPDIVFIAGDLIDGPVFPYERGLAPLSDIKSTYGVFYTAGNHDEYNPEQDKYYEALNKKVTVLNDKRVLVNDTQIVGVIYAEEGKDKTKERLMSTGFDPNTPSIVMLHDPKNVKALAESGVTLGLSGHTHGGQFFPSTFVVWCIYRELTKGIHYIQEMAHLTSVGVGTAGPLLRIGTQPEIAIIKIK